MLRCLLDIIQAWLSNKQPEAVHAVFVDFSDLIHVLSVLKKRLAKIWSDTV